MDRTGWLIYTREDAEKNKWFIEKFKSECQKFGITLKLVYTDDVPDNTENAASLVDITCDEYGIPSLAVNRSRQSFISTELESRGVRVFNPAAVTDIGNDKELSYRLAEKLNIPYMPFITASAAETGDICDKAAAFGYPFVLKPSDGHGGKHVFLIDNEAGLKDALKLMADECAGDQYKKLLIQRPCAVWGRDLRVYLVGGKIIAGTLRLAGNKNEFRANFSLGGRAVPHELNSEEQMLTKRISDALPSDFIGIDFIYDKDGRPVFNEIEDAVGSRMLYSETDIDIISLFARHIHSVTG
ncbi:MAG: ATP-grasp domain-containing protein [Lachnospiraceae bacterium]|nr:ATP-grasp domain-containing protein [Lachnospiraceae bacterium]